MQTKAGLADHLGHSQSPHLRLTNATEIPVQELDFTTWTGTAQALQASICSSCAIAISRPMSNPTAEWERVGDRFYRKNKLYDAVFDRDLELENYVIAGAPCAGAIGPSSRSCVEK